MTRNLFDTQKFNNFEKDERVEARDIIKQVYDSLTEKGYNPVNQIVGYIMSGDPTYITGHNNARTMITKLERDELLEEFVRHYIKSNL